MTPEQINIEIAKACGCRWYEFSHSAAKVKFRQLLTPHEQAQPWVVRHGGKPFTGTLSDADLNGAATENYHGSLDTMREPLSKLTEAQKSEFGEHAAIAIGCADDWYEGWQMGLSGFFDLITLPPEKISEIYVRTIGKWRDG